MSPQDLHQLLPRQTQPALTSRQRDIHDLRDFRQADAAVVMQRERLTLLLGDLL